MKLTGLEDLYLDQLKDLYSAENQILKALPKMARAASTPELRQAFEDHHQETEEHVQRLKKIFEKLDTRAGGKFCKGMRGLIHEGEEILKLRRGSEPHVIDSALICEAQKVEHYEIATYGCARTYAELLRDEEAVQLLDRTIHEEGEADKKLTGLAERINPLAVEGTGERKEFQKA
jgi:ferritin-like metal-binding protein YciE